MNRYTLTSSQLNAAEQQKSPAKDWQFYESTILKNRDNLGKILKEYKESGAWKEKYKSWAAACVPFSVSKRWANELIQTEQGGGPPTLANKTKKKEEACLTEIEEAREEREVEPETPAVHSADEVKQPEPKAHTNGHAVKAENGRPKQSFPVWRELEESLIGRAINRADGLNRLCPNTQMHARLIASLKTSLTILEQWKQSVQ